MSINNGRPGLPRVILDTVVNVTSGQQVSIPNALPNCRHVVEVTTPPAGPQTNVAAYLYVDGSAANGPCHWLVGQGNGAAPLADFTKYAQGLFLGYLAYGSGGVVRAEFSAMLNGYASFFSETFALSGNTHTFKVFGAWGNSGADWSTLSVRFDNACNSAGIRVTQIP